MMLRPLAGFVLCLSLLGACVPEDGVDPHLSQLGCASAYAATTPLAPDGSGLRISEVVSSNDGVLVDELGETDDWLELVNEGTAPVSLAKYVLTDAAGKPKPLPDVTLAPGAAMVLWADDTIAQGPMHLGLKLDAEGETLTLWADRCTPIERVAVPALAADQTYARFGAGDAPFVPCRYATPGKRNGASCTPPAPPDLSSDTTFTPFTWPAGFPGVPTPLALSELALGPAGFIELRNTSDRTVTLASYALRLAPLTAASARPSAAMGELLDWPVAVLAAGERVVVPVRPEQTAVLAQPEFEGVATLFGPGDAPIDRAEFMRIPEGAVLARVPESASPFTLCTNATPGAANVCAGKSTRTIGDRLRSLQTTGDFAQLAAGGAEIGQAPVKFVVDMERGDTVHLLGTARWALHYTFIREQLFGEPPLDRCDPVQAAQFDDDWYAFSEREYFRVSPRRFLLGTLIRHTNGLSTVEFTPGDVIEAPQMQRAFLAVIAHTEDPRAWALRPTTDAQVAEMKRLDGRLPIVSRNAPFTHLTYQPLTKAVGFGVLTFVPTTELARASLPAQTILVTDDVPNDVPFVGGLITEAFQTPLAHVNVLSQARGTPNMALRGARSTAALEPLFGKLVRLEVGATEFSIRPATSEEASAYWDLQRPSGPRVRAPFDLGKRALFVLGNARLEDLPAIGAKAAQFAELYRVPASCAETSFRVPPDAFAIPVVHYAEHFAASGAQALLQTRRAEPAFRADPGRRATALAEVREAMLRHPVAPALLAEVTAAVQQRYGSRRVRLRSSSNVEDLPTFNGAGLHSSVSAELDDPERALDDGLRTVWASLWNLRAYDERESANLDHDSAMMGVLVHQQAAGEAAQGVAISRDLLDVARADVYYVNAQVGEATVTNPAPGVTTEQLLYSSRSGAPQVDYQTRSSLSGGKPVLSADDLHGLECALVAIHEHYRPLLDPTGENRLFAMQIEFKIERDRTLVVKQARPQPFGHVQLPADCR